MVTEGNLMSQLVKRKVSKSDSVSKVCHASFGAMLAAERIC
jgi:hypothetical protein